MVSEVADITYHESMMIIVEAMLATVQEEFHITDEKIECFYMSLLYSGQLHPFTPKTYLDKTDL